MDIRFLTSLTHIDRAAWQSLRTDGYPFLHYDFLRALEDTGCVGPGTGWQPHYLTVWEQDRLLAAAPLYLKTDSWGEYVFDWAWADAYRRAGRAYYPKLVCAVPFTPASGPRLLGVLPDERWASVQAALEQWLQSQPVSGLHWLLATESEARQLAPRWSLREGTQFHWFNKDFASFEEFVGTFNARKRKSLMRERRKVAEAGVRLTRIVGADITPAQWDLFYHCYRHTYQKRSGHDGYLTRAFFQQLGTTLAGQCLMVLAERAGAPIAAALNLFDEQTLYGRYWGCLEAVDCLHFEACYYQGIEFAIERGLRRFDPGAQGEHKIQRGFTPVPVYSNHWIKDADARAAIEAFIRSEADHNRAYLRAAAELLPFKTPAE